MYRVTPTEYVQGLLARTSGSDAGRLASNAESEAKVTQPGQPLRRGQQPARRARSADGALGGAGDRRQPGGLGGDGAVRDRRRAAAALTLLASTGIEPGGSGDPDRHR